MRCAGNMARRHAHRASEHASNRNRSDAGPKKQSGACADPLLFYPQHAKCACRHYENGRNKICAHLCVCCCAQLNDTIAWHVVKSWAIAWHTCACSSPETPCALLLAPASIFQSNTCCFAKTTKWGKWHPIWCVVWWLLGKHGTGPRPKPPQTCLA